MSSKVVRFSSFFALATVGFALAVGCGAGSAGSEDSGDVVPDDEDEFRSQSWQKYMGEWSSTNGVVRGLILSANDVGSGRRFVLDHGRSSIRGRAEGTWTAGAKTITFKTSNTSALSGRYNLQLVTNGPPPGAVGMPVAPGGSSSGPPPGAMGLPVIPTPTTLILTKGSERIELQKLDSYCATPNDCLDNSDLIVPRCLGQFTCAADRCGYQCGRPTTCAGLDQQACQANANCEANWGPSHCSPSGICTRDIVFKGCREKSASTTCMSSATCATNEHCSTEDGECLPTGMLAVCSGRCVPGASR